MLNTDGLLRLTAADLAGHLRCNHLTQLEADAARGVRTPPPGREPRPDSLRKRGDRHARAYLDHLEATGCAIVRIGGVGLEEEQAAATADAMAAGAALIGRAVLLDRRWGGRADLLRRVERPGGRWDWSYEVVDTGLARQTRGGSLLQLCLHTDLVAQMQGLVPQFMHMVTPRSGFEPQTFRAADYLAWYRRAKRGLEAAMAEDRAAPTAPDPRPHCAICHWQQHCDAHRRADDHPGLVAGISGLQIAELKRRAIPTVAALAAEPLPLTWKPERGAVHSYERICKQARLQVAARAGGAPVHEPLEPIAGQGLARLPEPSAGDVFFDLQGDPHVGEGGLDYLFGQVAIDDRGQAQYRARWALDRDEERRAFEDFVDGIVARWQRHPNMHVYHFGPYEAAALKRLMGRYATREEEIDRMLRAGLPVDLAGVVRGGIRAGVESYTLQEFERFHGFERSIALPEANRALTQLRAGLEFADPGSVTAADRRAVQDSNRDNCLSILGLRNWLEAERSRQAAAGAGIARPEAGEADPGAAVSARQERVDALVAHLTRNVPAERADRSGGQQARWLLAHLADWHRREDKPVWWEYFRLSALSAADLLEERGALGGLEFVGRVADPVRGPVQRYRFPAQETDLRAGKVLMCVGGDRFGTLEALSFADRTVDIRTPAGSTGRPAPAVFAHDIVSTRILADSLIEIGEEVARTGTGGANPAALDLLLRRPPAVGGQPLQAAGETAAAAAQRIAPLLEGGVLPVQGPPGAGKTYTGARMICALVEAGARVGITANSHKVIRNLLDEVLAAAGERGTDLNAIQKTAARPPGWETDRDRLQFAARNADVFAALRDDCRVAGGTAWLWASPRARNAVDLLFVDEAAQMSLANLLAVSPAAAGLVLLGDPQQLQQPMQGSHPDGTAVSALDHLLGGRQTIEAGRGLFLDRTWRLHPDICAFTSEIFYEGRLHPRPGLERQRIVGNGPVAGSGLRYLPADHQGNQSSSVEEADLVQALVGTLMKQGAAWIDRHGDERPLGLDDILIVAPYNAHVFALQERLPGARIGTVDKFQGQEAPLVIYSMATSAPTDAPHGMEFLYSLNRLNVATSRARCASVLVANPALFEPDCRTPQQMRLANAFCRYGEMAETIRL